MTTIMITRPYSKSCNQLIDNLQNIGYKVISWPFIFLEDIPMASVPKLEDYDYLICVSIKAAERLVDLLAEAKNKNNNTYINLAQESIVRQKLLKGAPIFFTPGAATAEYLRLHGATVHYPPQTIGAAAMLAMEGLSNINRNKKVLVVCGEQGGKLPLKELSKKCDKVDKLALYKTRAIFYDKYLWLAEGHIDYIWATSENILRNLLVNIKKLSNISEQTTQRKSNFDKISLANRNLDISPDISKDSLLEIKIIVPSLRLYKLAKELGFVNVIKILDASNKQLIAYLQKQKL